MMVYGKVLKVLCMRGNCITFALGIKNKGEKKHESIIIHCIGNVVARWNGLDYKGC